MRTIIKEKTHLAVEVPDSTGKGGTSTKGNVHSRMSVKSNSQGFVYIVPRRFQEKMHNYISRFYTTPKV